MAVQESRVSLEPKATACLFLSDDHRDTGTLRDNFRVEPGYDNERWEMPMWKPGSCQDPVRNGLFQAT